MHQHVLVSCTQSRKLELAYCESSEIVHCEILADGTTDCIIAADALTYPNGKPLFRARA